MWVSSYHLFWSSLYWKVIITIKCVGSLHSHWLSVSTLKPFVQAASYLSSNLTLKLMWSNSISFFHLFAHSSAEYHCCVRFIWAYYFCGTLTSTFSLWIAIVSKAWTRLRLVSVKVSMGLKRECGSQATSNYKISFIWNNLASFIGAF